MEIYGFDMRSSSLGMTLFQGGEQTNKIWVSKVLEHDGLNELEVNLKTNLDGSPELQTLLDVVDALKRCFQFIYGAGYNDDERMRSISILVFTSEDSFIELLKEQHNEALCVLAFLCVPLHRMGYIWYMEGWGLHLMQIICSTLGSGFMMWIRWPIEEIGWVP
jgi:hypothetical protein